MKKRIILPLTIGIVGAGLINLRSNISDMFKEIRTVGALLIKGRPNFSLEQLGINASHLIKDSQLLVSEKLQTGKDFWTLSDGLPESISKLSPQFATIQEKKEATIIDIQISGGFQHFGYLVVCSSETPDFVPTKGNNWHIRKVAENVFEYSE